MKTKKYIFLALFALFAMSVQAKDGDQITLQAGTPNVFWTLKSAYFETYYSEAKVESDSWDQWLQKQGDDFVRDWPSDHEKVDTYFMSRFNKKTKRKDGINLQKTNPNDTYRFIIHFSDIDMGSIGGGVVASVFLGGFAKKSGGVNFKSGYVDVVEAATGKVVCRLSFKDVRGDSGLNVSAQLMLALEDLHDELIGFAERFKDKQMPETSVAALTSAPEPQQEAPVAVAAPAVAAEPAVAAPAATPAPTAPKAAAPKATTQKAAAPKAAAPKAAAPQGDQQVTVKLKNGATITGTMKSFDPLKEIVIVVAGHETKIPMTQVEKVETGQSAPAAVSQPTAVAQPTAQPAPQAASPAPASKTLGNEKLMVTEATGKPERISVNIGQTTIEMVLVSGGRMNMGYDGSGSRRMNSEPVHEVAVTSFYMSAQPLPAALVTEIVGTKNVDGTGSEPAQVREYEDVEKVISAVQSQTGLLLRLPTEAEWEYAACSDQQSAIFQIAMGHDVAYEWCSDFLDDYPEDEVVVTDPTGPSRGDEHVIRAYNSDRGKFDRSNKIDEDDAYLGLVRLVVKAKDIQ